MDGTTKLTLRRLNTFTPRSKFPICSHYSVTHSLFPFPKLTKPNLTKPKRGTGCWPEKKTKVNWKYDEESEENETRERDCWRYLKVYIEYWNSYFCFNWRHEWTRRLHNIYKTKVSKTWYVHTGESQVSRDKKRRKVCNYFDVYGYRLPYLLCTWLHVSQERQWTQTDSGGKTKPVQPGEVRDCRRYRRDY